MFLGTYHPRLDDKGRLFLPAKWREQLSGGLVITKGQENCLYVFPQADFAAMGASLRNAPVTAKALRDYSRVFFSSASDEIPDKQGRITVPAPLRHYAGLDKECVALGVNDRVEIWDVAAHEAWLPESERAFSEVADEVMPGAL